MRRLDGRLKGCPTCAKIQSRLPSSPRRETPALSFFGTPTKDCLWRPTSSCCALYGTKETEWVIRWDERRGSVGTGTCHAVLFCHDFCFEVLSGTTNRGEITLMIEASEATHAQLYACCLEQLYMHELQRLKHTHAAIGPSNCNCLYVSLFAFSNGTRWYEHYAIFRLTHVRHYLSQAVCITTRRQSHGFPFTCGNERI